MHSGITAFVVVVVAIVLKVVIMIGAVVVITWLTVSVFRQVVIRGNLPSPQNWPLKSSKLVSQVKAPPTLFAITQLH